MKEEAWITTAQAGRLLGLSRPTLYRLAKIKGVKVKRERLTVTTERLMWDRRGLGELIPLLGNDYTRQRVKGRRRGGG